MPKQYFHNLLQRVEALQFNPSFQVKEIAIEDVELVERQWFAQTPVSSEMRRFIRRHTKQSRDKVQHTNLAPVVYGVRTGPLFSGIPHFFPAVGDRIFFRQNFDRIFFRGIFFPNFFRWNLKFFSQNFFLSLTLKKIFLTLKF